MQVIVIKSKELEEELKMNGIEYTRKGCKFEIENTLKARMAIRMIKERFGPHLIKEV